MKPSEQLKAFFDHYMVNPQRLFPPCLRGVHFVDGLTATVIYRREPFQVELVTCSPNLELPEHTHPNVDSFEVYLSGELLFSLDGKQVVPDDAAKAVNWDGIHPLIGKAIRVLPGAPHGLRVGPNGGTFLSVQHWLNGKPLSTVGDDWEGDSMGPLHGARLAGPAGAVGVIGEP